MHNELSITVSRALKCYQKAVQLQPDHVEALSCTGDLLFTTGHEVIHKLQCILAHVYMCTWICLPLPSNQRFYRITGFKMGV